MINISKYHYRCSKCGREFDKEYRPGSTIRCPSCNFPMPDGEFSPGLDKIEHRAERANRKKIIISMLLTSILSVYGANLFLCLPPQNVVFMTDSPGFNLLAAIGFIILTLGHELLHTHAWKYFGYTAKVTLVLPMFGLSRGTKPRTQEENFLISMAPILLTIVAFVFLLLENNPSGRSDYLFLALLNTAGMGYDLINALTGS